MNILLTGANGYIGQRLLPVLLEQGHTVHCCVRSRQRFEAPSHARMHVLELDFLQPPADAALPAAIDVAFFLIHAMGEKATFPAGSRLPQKISSGSCRVPNAGRSCI